MGKRIIRKSSDLAPNSVALGVMVFGAHTSLYLQHLSFIEGEIVNIYIYMFIPMLPQGQCIVVLVKH